MGEIDIRLKLPNDHIYANADKDSIQQAFVNLIENAIQAMEKGGTLTIRLSKKEKIQNGID